MRYPLSQALLPSYCSWGAEVLWLVLTACASGVGERLPVLSRCLASNPLFSRCQHRSYVAQSPQRGCRRAARALSTPSLQVHGVSKALPGLLCSSCSRWELEGVSPSPPALLGTAGAQGGQWDLSQGSYRSTRAVTESWQLGPCWGSPCSPGCQPGLAPLGEQGQQPSRPVYYPCKRGLPIVSPLKAVAALPARQGSPAPASRPPDRVPLGEAGLAESTGWVKRRQGAAVSAPAVRPAVAPGPQRGRWQRRGCWLRPPRPAMKQ